jgi:predicted NUDIX family NTP pyrophosphohydrolase
MSKPRQKQSAGLLMFRQRDERLEVLLGHPGGPYWAGRHDGAWTLPKGGIQAGEEPLAGAIREFQEETGFDPAGPFLPLGSIIQRSGKRVQAWAFRGDGDPAKLVSSRTTTEWPPKSGERIDIPEIDQLQFFPVSDAKRAINVAQAEFLDRLSELIGNG